MKNGNYTVTQSVIDTLEALPWDVEWHCYEFFSLCRKNLRLHNSPANPYDGTLQRAMRKFRHVYNVICVNSKKSIYVKESNEGQYKSEHNPIDN